MSPLTVNELRAGLHSIPQELYDIISALVLPGKTWSTRKDFPAQLQINHNSRKHYQSLPRPRRLMRYAMPYEVRRMLFLRDIVNEKARIAWSQLARENHAETAEPKVNTVKIVPRLIGGAVVRTGGCGRQGDGDIVEGYCSEVGSFCLSYLGFVAYSTETRYVIR